VKEDGVDFLQADMTTLRSCSTTTIQPVLLHPLALIFGWMDSP